MTFRENVYLATLQSLQCLFSLLRLCFTIPSLHFTWAVEVGLKHRLGITPNPTLCAFSRCSYCPSPWPIKLFQENWLRWKAICFYRDGKLKFTVAVTSCSAERLGRLLYLCSCKSWIHCLEKVWVRRNRHWLKHASVIVEIKWNDIRKFPKHFIFNSHTTWTNNNIPNLLPHQPFFTIVWSRYLFYFWFLWHLHEKWNFNCSWDL